LLGLFEGREVGGSRLIIFLSIFLTLLDFLGIGEGVEDFMGCLTLLREKLQHKIVGSVSRNHIVDVDWVYLADPMGTVLRLD